MKNLLLSIVLGSCFLAPAYAKDSAEREQEGKSKPLVSTTVAGNAAAMEPETYALLLAGLGMLVTIVRRSSAKHG